MSILPCFAFSSNWAWAVAELASARGTGRSAGDDIGCAPHRKARRIRRAVVFMELLGRCGLRRRTALEHPVRPGDEVFPIGAVGVSAVVLAPRELPIEQAHVHFRHLLL